MGMSKTAFGIDFGTTNSSIAHANDVGEVRLAHFPFMGEMTAVAYRSLLYLEQVKERGVNALKSWSGPEGIELLPFCRPQRPIDSIAEVLSEQPQSRGYECFWPHIYTRGTHRADPERSEWKSYFAVWLSHFESRSRQTGTICRGGKRKKTIATRKPVFERHFKLLDSSP